MHLDEFVYYARAMGELKVTAEELIAFARILSNQTLETIARRKRFEVQVQDPSGTQPRQSLIFIPLSTKKPRKQQWQHIVNVIEKFNTTSVNERMKTKTYGNNSINASYQLALMQVYFGHINIGASKTD